MFPFDESKACRNCLLPEPFATLNDEGICRSCVEYKPTKLLGLETLKKEIEALPRPGKYDCIVAISGGRDSMYALYVIVKILGLRTLAYNNDNEFMHPQATANMEAACKKLGVDFISCKSKKDYCHKIVADQIRYSVQHGAVALEMHICSACNVTGFLNGRRLMKEHRVPAMVLGNSAEEKLNFKLGQRVPLKKKLLSNTMPYYLRAQYWKMLSRMELTSEFSDVLRLKFQPKNDEYQDQEVSEGKILGIYDYIKWDRREIVSTIEEHLDWSRPDGAISSWRFDCPLIDLVNYVWVKASGFPKAFFGYTSMVRTGTMTREEALSQLKAKDWGKFTPEMEEVLAKDVRIQQKYIDEIKAL